MNFERKDLTAEQLLQLYQNLLWPRMIEEKMLVLLRQGKISKWFSGIGQEAISVGATLAMEPNEWIMPLHRNLGVFTSRNMPLNKLFKQWQGSTDGYSKGRERSFHFGSREHHICGMISHLGPQLAIAGGAALAYKLNGHLAEGGKVSLAFTGEGGTSEGDFHEALNVAAVWDLPVIFMIENNGYGLSTPVSEQYRCENLIDRARGYGMEGVRIDGNNILAVYDTIKGVRAYCHKNQKPYLIECMTFRMRGHEEASGVKYVPPALLAAWEKKDPIANFEKFLLAEKVLTPAGIEKIKFDNKQLIELEIELGFNSAPTRVDSEKELRDMYSEVRSTNPGSYREELQIPIVTGTKHESGLEQNKVLANEPVAPVKYFEAIKQAMEQAMERYSNLVIMGQDIAEYGGAFKLTEGFVEKFGKARIRNTPICESAIAGIALGLSLERFKSIVEMQFADFATVAFNQIVNNLAKLYYRWGQNADVVIRMPTGGGVGAGPFHSQSNEAWFTKVPGLKVVYPSSAFDAKGLLVAAINDPNPVLFFEHKALYRSVSGNVPAEWYEVEIGKARIVQEGNELSIITYGQGVHWAVEQMKELKKEGINIEILDLRTLAPLDYEAIAATVKKNGKVLVLTEDTTMGSIASEISAWVNENLFEYLDAPVMRCGSLETAIPFNSELEKNFMAKSRLGAMLMRLLKY